MSLEKFQLTYTYRSAMTKLDRIVVRRGANARRADFPESMARLPYGSLEISKDYHFAEGR
jgi:hypothetical protein